MCDEIKQIALFLKPSRLTNLEWRRRRRLSIILIPHIVHFVEMSTELSPETFSFLDELACLLDDRVSAQVFELMKRKCPLYRDIE